MTPERWQRIKDLIEIVESASPEERKTTLERLCDGDRELIEEVETYLDHEGFETFFCEAIRREALDLEDEASTQKFARYKVLRRVCHGGMGAVYEAVRTDGYQQRAAIKVIRQELDSDYARERFVRERQLLATLEHPYIARLLDGGETKSGSPWLVLEFVEGKPIDQYCAGRDRGTLLELFLKVCDAVEYAHRNLVVHRDLKPANILVTESGEPKLLDFGIAKLLDADASRTQTGFAAMTPEYASPEQVRGEAITTASDVYSLGVILYQLLTERKPYTIDTISPLEIHRIVCELPVPPAGLDDEIDNILAMALRKEPERRYASVRDFAADIIRYRSNQPVAARPDTALYRVRKYVRRNWAGVLAASVALSSILAGAGLAIYQARIAEERFQQVRKLSHRFIFDFNDRIRALPGSTEVREMMVATALEYLDSLSTRAGGDADLQWELAKAYEKVGDVQGSPVEPSLGHAAEALKSYRKAIAMQEDLARRNLLSTAQQGSVAHAYAQMAGVYRGFNDPAAAVDAASRGMEHARRGSEGDVAAASTHLALAQLMAGDPAAALATNRMAEATVTRRANGETGWGPAHASLAALYGSIGRAEIRLARFDDGVSHYSRSIAIRELQLSDPTLDTVNARELVLNYHAVGDALGGSSRYSLGRYPEAASWYRKALALAERMAAADVKNASARFEVVRSQGKLGAALERSQPAESLRLFERALDEANQLLPPGEVRDGLRASAYRSMSGPLASLGRIDESRQKLQLCFDIDEASLRRHPKSASAVADLGEDWLKRGDIEWPRQKTEALAAWRKGLAFAQQYAALLPKDFFASYLEDKALRSLILHTDTQDPANASLRKTLVELWAGWDRMIPGSSFIQDRLRQVAEHN